MRATFIAAAVAATVLVPSFANAQVVIPAYGFEPAGVYSTTQPGQAVSGRSAGNVRQHSQEQQPNAQTPVTPFYPFYPF